MLSCSSHYSRPPKYFRKVLISPGLSNCLFRLHRGIVPGIYKIPLWPNELTIWSSIALFHPNCPLLQMLDSFSRIQGPRKEEWMKQGWGPRAKESWHSSNFSRQMYTNTVVQDFVQQMNSRILPGFLLASLVLLKRRLLSSARGALALHPRTQTLNFSSWRGPDQ